MAASNNTYASSGVNIAAGQQAVDLMAHAVRSTYNTQVLAGIGAFGGLYDAAMLKQMAAPVLVASTDGVGTKTKVAAQLGRWDTIGRDLVHHCINDILVQGADPLFFMDYVASSKLDTAQIATVVIGVAEACRETGCALIGGETAEMPGVYEAGEIDLAGTIIGAVERSRIVDGSRIVPGNVILGLPSSGLHTNGYSLARRVLADLDWQSRLDGEVSIGDALMAVHRCYLQDVHRLWAAGIDIRGMAHITGGGFIDNLPRILPAGTAAIIESGAWPEPPIFKLIQEHGQIDRSEMFHVFNMGLGLLIVVPADQVQLAVHALESGACLVGRITSGDRAVTIR